MVVKKTQAVAPLIWIFKGHYTSFHKQFRILRMAEQRLTCHNSRSESIIVLLCRDKLKALAQEWRNKVILHPNRTYDKSFAICHAYRTDEKDELFLLAVPAAACKSLKLPATTLAASALRILKGPSLLARWPAIWAHVSIAQPTWKQQCC